MTPKNDGKSPVEGEAGEKLPPTRDFIRLIEEYANDLRKMFEKLRTRLH
jgi:hypothetical protein